MRSSISAAIAGLALCSACVQPLRLAHDDSPVVLSHQQLTAPNPADKGTFRVHTMYYGSGKDRQRAEYRDSVTLKTRSVDGSKLAKATTPAAGKARKKFFGFGFDSMPVNGRVWYPEGDGPFPLVLIVHGNHDMEKFSDPGYAYLGELFASRGYIFVSVDENFLNGNIRGENDARGWMLLKHLEAWRGFNDSTTSPFHGKVDMTRIALMGHSRGGEAVADAAAFNTLSNYPDDATIKFNFHFNIKSIVAIAPVDGQYTPADRPTPLSNINYLVIHGSHDGDVSAFSGLRQYGRIKFTDGGSWFKAAVWMYRANHGQWNTVWGNTDDGPESRRILDLRGLIAPEEQRQMARVFISAFLDATLKGKSEYLPIFRDYRSIGGWLPKTMYETRFMESGFRPLATFDEDVDVTTGSTPGVTIAGDSLATWKEAVVPLRWKNTNVGQNAAWIGWNNRIAGKDTTKYGRPAAYAVSISDSVRTAWKVGAGTALEFSLAPTDTKPGPRAVAKDTTARGKAAADSAKKADAAKKGVKEPKTPPHKPNALDSLPVEFSIEAIDANGVAVRLPSARYGVARLPLDVTVMKRKGEDKTNFSALAEMVPQTFVIPLSDFRAQDPKFDPARLVTIRWVFDQTKAGTVVLTDIGLSNIAPAFILPEP